VVSIFLPVISQSPTGFELNQSATGNKYTFAGDAGVNKNKDFKYLSIQANIPVKRYLKMFSLDLKSLLRVAVAVYNQPVSSVYASKVVMINFIRLISDAVQMPIMLIIAPALRVNQVQVTPCVPVGMFVETIDFPPGSVCFIQRSLHLILKEPAGDTVNFQLDPP